jgi:hypothetical protein
MTVSAGHRFEASQALRGRCCPGLVKCTKTEGSIRTVPLRGIALGKLSPRVDEFVEVFVERLERATVDVPVRLFADQRRSMSSMSVVCNSSPTGLSRWFERCNRLAIIGPPGLR